MAGGKDVMEMERFDTGLDSCPIIIIVTVCTRRVMRTGANDVFRGDEFWRGGTAQIPRQSSLPNLRLTYLSLPIYIIYNIHIYVGWGIIINIIRRQPRRFIGRRIAVTTAHYIPHDGEVYCAVYIV